MPRSPPCQPSRSTSPEPAAAREQPPSPPLLPPSPPARNPRPSSPSAPRTSAPWPAPPDPRRPHARPACPHLTLGAVTELEAVVTVSELRTWTGIRGLDPPADLVSVDADHRGRHPGIPAAIEAVRQYRPTDVGAVAAFAVRCVWRTRNDGAASSGSCSSSCRTRGHPACPSSDRGGTPRSANIGARPGTIAPRVPASALVRFVGLSPGPSSVPTTPTSSLAAISRRAEPPSARSRPRVGSHDPDPGLRHSSAASDRQRLSSSHRRSMNPP
jgi:hypothetical protein